MFCCILFKIFSEIHSVLVIGYWLLVFSFNYQISTLTNYQIKNYFSGLHNLTKRDCFSRMTKEKVHCMEIAKKYDKDYWDGDRKYGYGGYKYIPGRWKPLAELLIKNYNLGPDSRVLDIGCCKVFLLYEMLLLDPKLKIFGCDVSKYAIRNSKEEIKSSLFVHNVKDKFNYSYINVFSFFRIS